MPRLSNGPQRTQTWSAPERMKGSDGGSRNPRRKRTYHFQPGTGLFEAIADPLPGRKRDCHEKIRGFGVTGFWLIWFTAARNRVYSRAPAILPPSRGAFVARERGNFLAGSAEAAQRFG